MVLFEILTILFGLLAFVSFMLFIYGLFSDRPTLALYGFTISVFLVFPTGLCAGMQSDKTELDLVVLHNNQPVKVYKNVHSVDTVDKYIKEQARLKQLMKGVADD